MATRNYEPLDEESEHLESSQETEISSQDSVSSNNESEEEGEYAWSRLQDEAERRHVEEWKDLVEQYEQQRDSREVAEVRASNSMLPVYRKELRSVFLEHLKWMHSMKKDPDYRKVMETKRELMDADSFDWEEATEAAISKRKFLLNRLFTKQTIPENKTLTYQ